LTKRKVKNIFFMHAPQGHDNKLEPLSRIRAHTRAYKTSEKKL